MVDVIKSLPLAQALPSTNLYRRQNRPTNKQISLPIFVSTVDNISQYDRTTFFQNNKRWIERYTGGTLRQIDISNVPYSMHRKVIDSELARCYPVTTVDMSASIKIKQQKKNSNKEQLKTATTVRSPSVLSSIDSQNSHLIDGLSKHVIIKSEPVRPANYIVHHTNKISSSWQKYWTSTHTQRQR